MQVNIAEDQLKSPPHFEDEVALIPSSLRTPTNRKDGNLIEIYNSREKLLQQKRTSSLRAKFFLKRINQSTFNNGRSSAMGTGQSKSPSYFFLDVEFIRVLVEKVKYRIFILETFVNSTPSSGFPSRAAPIWCEGVRTGIDLINRSRFSEIEQVSIIDVGFHELMLQNSGRKSIMPFRQVCFTSLFEIVRFQGGIEGLPGDSSMNNGLPN